MLISASHTDRAGLTVSASTGPVTLLPGVSTLVGSFDIRGNARVLFTVNNTGTNPLTALTVAVAASATGASAPLLSNGDLDKPNGYVRYSTTAVYQQPAGSAGAFELLPAGGTSRYDLYLTSTGGTTVVTEVSTGVTPIGS